MNWPTISVVKPINKDKNKGISITDNGIKYLKLSSIVREYEIQKSHQDKSRTRKRNLSKRDFLDKVFFYKYFLIFFTYTSSKKKIGSIKLIKEKLNGWNENTLKSPSKKGDKYNTNNLLSKSF